MWERLEIYKHVHDIDYKVLNALESIKIITRIDTSLHFLIGVKIVIFCILIAGKQTMEYFFSIQKNVFFNNKKSNKKKKKIIFNPWLTYLLMCTKTVFKASI